MSLALHLRALGRRNGSNTLAPCHDLSFRQQCWSLLQTRFLVGLPRQVFLEIIILYESGVGEGAVRSAGRRARKERRPSCSGRKPSHGAERCWRSCSCPAPAPLLPRSCQLPGQSRATILLGDLHHKLHQLHLGRGLGTPSQLHSRCWSPMRAWCIT